MRICTAILFLALSASASADVVVLQNGDRLTGQVVHKRDAMLVFAATHAGKVRIPWIQVSTLTTEKPVAVMLRDATGVTHDTLTAAGDGRVRLRDSARELPLNTIAYLNPGPEQSGVGVSYRGRVSLAASDTSGNSESRRIYADAELSARGGDYRYNLGAKIDRQQETGQQTASNWRTSGNYDWFLDPRTFRYLRGSFEYDRFKDIDLRTTVGGGYGLQLFEDDRTNVSVRGGIDYVVVERTIAPDDDYPALGWGLRASHRLDAYDIELFHEQDGYLKLVDGNGVTLQSRTGLRAPIAAGVNASIQLNLDWEEKPAAGRKSTDSVLLVGLGYAW